MALDSIQKNVREAQLSLSLAGAVFRGDRADLMSAWWKFGDVSGTFVMETVVLISYRRRRSKIRVCY